MADARRIVLDVLKPHDPPLRKFTEHIADAETVDAATGSLIELDQEVQNVKITVEGTALDYAAIEESIENLGGTVHSVDQAAYGEYIAEDHRTLQDG
ncbi:DUF211 domain-containing protein [Halogeometricum borinquense]|uniref:DUF211 domain-containing protein n=1 Tax=Halogeometricum borinquense TaxID=60847 RepID=A0A6C0UM54_9EURY|nr:DUF211 domain-containing protein [Halogeometricum borinquense]QIB75663.1 DUF211 domain-containing protein [Halogeometricum borinquense]